MAAPNWLSKLRPVHEQRMLLLALGAGFPAVLVTLILLWTGSFPPRTQWTLSILIIVIWWGCATAIRAVLRAYVSNSSS